MVAKLISEDSGALSFKIETETPTNEQIEQGQHPGDNWSAKEKTLVRKLDMTLLPMLWILYLFNHLDRNTIAHARLNSFEDDLGLTGDQFNIAVSILNVSLYLPFCAALWSVVSGSTAGAKDFGGLVTIRFFLGLVEAPFFPGAVFILSCWYTRRELALRTAILYSGSVLATAVSGLVAAGVFASLDGVAGLAGWQWLFTIVSATSSVAAIAAVYVLPDYPESKTGNGRRLFTEDERQVAVERIARDRVSTPETNGSVFYGLKLATSDYRTWIFALLLCSNHSASGFNNFFPTILKGFNFGSTTLTLILTSPPYLIGAIISFVVAFCSDRKNERGFHIAVPMVAALVGFAISIGTLNVPSRYLGSFLYTSGCFSANALIYSWVASTLNQTKEKRACATSIVNLVSHLGAIWSPYFFPKDDGPRYVMAMLLMLAFSFLEIVCCMFLKFNLKRANARLRAMGEAEGRNVVLYTL